MKKIISRVTPQSTQPYLGFPKIPQFKNPALFLKIAAAKFRETSTGNRRRRWPRWPPPSTSPSRPPRRPATPTTSLCGPPRRGRPWPGRPGRPGRRRREGECVTCRRRRRSSRRPDRPGDQDRSHYTCPFRDFSLSLLSASLKLRIIF